MAKQTQQTWSFRGVPWRSVAIGHQSSFGFRAWPKWGPPRSTGLPTTCSEPICNQSKHCDGLTCCHTQMFEALVAITDFLDTKLVKYVLLGGTLLGAFRENDIIHWDNDIDIGVSYEEINRIRITEQHSIPWNFWWSSEGEHMRGCENHHPGFPDDYLKPRTIEKDG